MLASKLLVGHSCLSLWSQKNLRRLEDPLEEREWDCFICRLPGWLAWKGNQLVVLWQSRRVGYQFHPLAACQLCLAHTALSVNACSNWNCSWGPRLKSGLSCNGKPGEVRFTNLWQLFSHHNSWKPTGEVTSKEFIFKSFFSGGRR